ncbi:MAG: bleomycin resistance protein [SAR324 cluster bacterium]|uniref:Bleomycin resistance protein n=1 Tax=SAR324 cluster bacterium TaxID=2024889 RepID=A0A2A4T3M6_9DELT|nr:MAG: bleomycin resistance protein [SAR324 cluster bacterium]
MEITLNHTIVPSYSNVESARFYERIFGFEFLKEWGHFAVVKVNQTLTLDFINSDNFSSLHYAFKVSEQQFDEILERIKAESVVYGSGPDSVSDGEINNRFGGRGVYFKDPNGHILEIITTDYVLD